MDRKVAEEVKRDRIPEHLVTKILLKTPIKSILRFRCVSQSWNSLITLPYFIKEHLANAKPLILRTENPVVSLSLLLDSEGLDRSLQIEFHRPHSFEIVASCNGVVFLRGRHREFDGRRLILWNPSIKKTLYLPPPRSYASTVTTLLGLGYDPRSDDYKVPRIVRLGNSAEHPFVFQFFSLNCGSWSENVDFFSNSLENKDALRSITISCYDNQAMVNGVIHWLLNHRDGIAMEMSSIATEMSSDRWSPLLPHNNVIVLTFHLSNDTFGEIRVPECFDDTTKWVTCSTISVFKDLLSFNVFEHVSYSRGYNCEIWVMEQYGVRESWTRLYQIEMLHLARPVVLRSNGEILMAGYRSDRLVSCQPLTQRIRDTGWCYQPMATLLILYKVLLYLINETRLDSAKKGC